MKCYTGLSATPPGVRIATRNDLWEDCLEPLTMRARPTPLWQLLTSSLVLALAGCASTPEGPKGKKLLRDYELCIAAECMSESWLLP